LLYCIAWDLIYQKLPLSDKYPEAAKLPQGIAFTFWSKLIVLETFLCRQENGMTK